MKVLKESLSKKRKNEMEGFLEITEFGVRQIVRPISLEPKEDSRWHPVKDE